MTNRPSASLDKDDCTSVLVVDNHPIVIEGLTRLLNATGEFSVQWTATSAQEALRICRSHTPDLAIVDISQPDGSGLDLVAALHACCNSTAILVLSMHDEARYAEPAIQAGARGYVMKQMPSKEILRAVRAIQKDGVYLSEKMIAAFISRAASKTAGEADTRLASLSRREVQVLELIGMGNKESEIAAKLERSAHTIETHRVSIKRKLRLSSSAALARVAFLSIHISSGESYQGTNAITKALDHLH